MLSQTLCRDPRIRDAFHDAIVWVSAGRESMHGVHKRMAEVLAVLGESVGRDVGPLAIENRYRTALSRKPVLIVIDDVWSRADLDPFLAESSLSRILFATRDASIARFNGAETFSIRLLDTSGARWLLAARADLAAEKLPPAADKLISECGRFPLALAMVGAILRGAGPDDWLDMVGRLRELTCRRSSTITSRPVKCFPCGQVEPQCYGSGVPGEVQKAGGSPGRYQRLRSRPPFTLGMPCTRSQANGGNYR